MKTNYWFFIMNRTLSGIVNGLFYAGSKLLFPVMCLFLGFTLFQLISGIEWEALHGFRKWLTIAGIVGTALTIVLLGISFKFPKFKLSDIHLWTWANQTTLAGTYFAGRWKNWKWLLLAVYPAVFLQKLFINLFSGLHWNYIGTDDVSGKTWGMKIFGRTIKIPRIMNGNMYFRLFLAIISIGFFVYLSHHHQNLHNTKMIIV